MESLSVKSKLNTLTICLTLALAGMVSGCNDDDDDDNQEEPPVSQVKDAAYYQKMAKEAAGKMSVEEKLNMVVGPGMDMGNGEFPATNNKNDVSGVAGYINGVKSDKLDIPAAKLADGPAGLRINSTRSGSSETFYATAWPIGSLLASSWDTKLVAQVGKAMGEEIKEYGVDFILAPGMNIQRNPLNGRNFEYYSEDPLLSGKIAAAMVDGVESNQVGTTIKHFVANNSETNRNAIDTIVSPRAMREIYLRGFQIAVEEAQPWAVMSSYNKLNGTYTNERRDLLTDILRNEWDFKGLVMSDWLAGTPQLTGWKQLKAGNDLIEPGGFTDPVTGAFNNTGVLAALKDSYKKGDISEADVTVNVEHILSQVFQSPSYNNYAASNKPDLEQHRVLARQAAAESMVLLKNDNQALPLTPRLKLASFGVSQIETIKGGTGSGQVNNEATVMLSEGLQQQYTVDESLTSFYRDYYAQNKVEHPGFVASIGTYFTCDDPAIDPAVVESAAQNNDAALITIGRIAGEGVDRTNTRGDYLLTENELSLIQNTSDAFHAAGKKVVVVLDVSAIVDTSEWADKVDAILLSYLPGQEAGFAITDVLSGVVNPGGKLAQTIPQSYADVPSATTFPGKDTNGDGTPDEISYNDDIYVGYRYYSTFSKPVAWPFGYGLSYTTFGYDGAAVESNTLSNGAKGGVTLSVSVTNTGNVAGKEAAQVYISAPEVKLKKPALELKSFSKTDSLQPGASQKLTFTIPAKTLASFDPQKNQWIVEPGTYKAWVSPSSDVTGREPVTFNVSEEIVVSNTTPGALALPAGVNAADFVTVSQ
ncbi:glycoside hydrolase family 3 C-terminal domain-containing protein [Buttiauxella noackiae]|uniref:beta-glucosidase n=1 Tax=Buttiauxella noackiae TaxID=82992 RepID=UPI0028D5BEDE|nr:glycoside hydrolase family 3 C-terminal domain-containing protein [Buttiauxella noackiae]